MNPTNPPSEIVILETERICGEAIARMLGRVFPKARIRWETQAAAAAEIVDGGEVDLFVVTVRGFDLDVLTLLGVWAEHRAERTRVVVVTPNPNSAVLSALRGLPLSGVFDSSRGDIGELALACLIVADGDEYWSENVSLPAGAHGMDADEPDSCDYRGASREGEARVRPPRFRSARKPPPRRV